MNTNQKSYKFQLTNQLRDARAGEMQTAHGTALTPMYMAVGTLANVRALSSEDILEINPQMLLANTYHLYLRPGHELISQLGGLHQFMRYPRPMLTDSGGFQVFSLGEQLSQRRGFNQQSGENSSPRLKPAVITEKGVAFYSHLDGSKHLISPEKSIAIQQHLGADIIMAFDECLPDDVEYDRAAASVERTFRWAKRCVESWEHSGRQSQQGQYQALFGIVQGARYEDLRLRALQQISSLPVDGLALGGETIGYNMEGTKQVMNQVRSSIPPQLARYAMGLGRDPQNLIDAVAVGFDMFDCVAPTRLARNGTLYHGRLQIPDNNDSDPNSWRWESPFARGRLQIGNARFKSDTSVIMPGCDCWTCRQGYTRAYLHHLYRNGGEFTYFRLATIHNVRVMVRLTDQLRSLIVKQGRKDSI